MRKFPEGGVYARGHLDAAARATTPVAPCSRADLAGPCVAVSVGLVRPPEGDGLADVLSGAECFQNEAGDVGSRNRGRDRARADPCGVAASACSRRQAGRTDDGVVEAALTDRLLLQDLVGVGPSKEQGERRLSQTPNELWTMRRRTPAPFRAAIRFRVPSEKTLVGLRAAAKETPSIDTAASWPRAAASREC